MNNFYKDDYLDYYVVVEQASPENREMQILEKVNNINGLNYLRFRTCLQSFGRRNRNRRLWVSPIMKKMLAEPHVSELLNKGGIPGENGHPVPDTGQVTMERILTIDPNNMSHRILSLEWVGEKLYGTVETLDEGPGTPGFKFMRNIMQGLDPSFSLRSIVPQRKNMDGSIDVTGPGRFITFDRVILPSHDDAYIDKSIPVKNVITKPQFETVMESFSDLILEKSEKVNRIIDKMQPAIESLTLDKNGIVGVNTEKEGRIYIAPETKFRNEIKSFMKNL